MRHETKYRRTVNREARDRQSPLSGVVVGFIACLLLFGCGTVIQTAETIDQRLDRLGYSVAAPEWVKVGDYKPIVWDEVKYGGTVYGGIKYLPAEPLNVKFTQDGYRVLSTAIIDSGRIGFPQFYLGNLVSPDSIVGREISLLGKYQAASAVSYGGVWFVLLVDATRVDSALIRTRFGYVPVELN